VDQEKIEEILEENNRLAKENRKLLKKINSRGRSASIMRFVRTLVFVVLLAALYYYIQPYIVAVMAAYNTLTETVNTAKGIIDGPFDFLKKE